MTAAPPSPATAPEPLAARLDAVLPQTQCRRCGWDDCTDYARAMAAGEAGIDRCPPGGVEGVARLAALTGRPARGLDPAVGAEGPRGVARIVEADCIGCTRCIQACPVDCIVGAARRMHSVVTAQCTGCALCLPACPVDCIDWDIATPGRSGWQAWSSEQASEARRRYDARRARRQRRNARHEAALAALAP